jgi:hypothetical protein
MNTRKDLMATREFESVHDSHCCPDHGCKYGDEDCPVVLGKELGVFCEMCENDEHDPDVQLRKKLVAALHEAYVALRRGRPQIYGILPAQDFDSAIASAKEALEAAEGKFHETNTDNPVDFSRSK